MANVQGLASPDLAGGAHLLEAAGVLQAAGLPRLIGGVLGSAGDGLGGRGLGASATRIFDGRVLTYGGKDYVYLTAGNGSSGFRVFRLVQ